MVLHAKQNKKMKRTAAHVDSALLATNVTSLQTAAAAVAAADAGALGTVTVTAVTAPNPTALSAAVQAAISGGESPTEAEFNALRLEVVDLRARMVEVLTLLADLRLRAGEVDVAVASLATLGGEARTLGNDLKAKYNALATAVDAL